MKKKKLRKFRAIVFFVDTKDNIHKRRIIIKSETASKAYTQLKNENGVLEIVEFIEID